MRRTCSTVSCTAGILPSAHGFKDRGLDLSVMVGSLIALRSFLVVAFQAAKPDFRDEFSCFLSNDELTLVKALSRLLISLSLVDQPKLTRTAPCAREGSTPMAARTCEACTLPDEQAEPEDTATPLRSKEIIAVSAFMPGTAKSVVLGKRGAPCPKMIARGAIALMPASTRSRKPAMRAAAALNQQE